MQCPHCFLDMNIIVLSSGEVGECPSCEGLWLDSISIANFFGLDETMMHPTNIQVRDNRESETSRSSGDYYYYKKSFRINASSENLCGFE